MHCYDEILIKTSKVYCQKTQTRGPVEVLNNKGTSGKTAKELILLQNIRSLTENFDELKIITSQTEVEPVAFYLTET